MLFNKLTINFTDILSSNGIPLYATPPAGALVMSNSVLSSGTFIAKSNLIRGVDYLSVGSSIGGSISGGSAGTLSSSGNHASSNYLYSNNTIDAPAISYSPANGSAGSHSHTISNVYSGLTPGLPLSRMLGFYSLPVGTTNLPSGAIVFAASNPGPGFTATTYTEWLAGASTTASIGSTTGSDSARSWSASTSSAGYHSHPTSGVAYDSYNSFLPTTTAAFTATSGNGSHSHGITMSGNWSINNYVTVKSFVSDGSAIISSGCIIAWNQSNNVLPAGWVFCDGSTVRGVTTPNLNGSRLLKLNPTSHGVVTTGTDTFSAGVSSASYNANHSHLQGSQIIRNSGGVAFQQHNSDNWNHSHGLSLASGYAAATPASIGLSFIMYIP